MNATTLTVLILMSNLFRHQIDTVSLWPLQLQEVLKVVANGMRMANYCLGSLEHAAHAFSM